MKNLNRLSDYLYISDKSFTGGYTNETHSEVYACDSIHDDEDICICQLLEAEI